VARVSIREGTVYWAAGALTLFASLLWWGLKCSGEAQRLQELSTRQQIKIGQLMQERDQALSVADYQDSMVDYWKGAYHGSVKTRGCDCVDEMRNLAEESAFHLRMDMEEHGKLASCYACAPKCREAEE